jgi:hypothetical protein
MSSCFSRIVFGIAPSQAGGLLDARVASQTALMLAPAL